MAAFFRLESFCDECDAPSCAAGDGITPGCAWVGWELDLLLRALDLGHLVWNRAEVCGVSSRWRRFTVVTKRRDLSSVGRHGVVHTGGVWLWMRAPALPEAGGHRVRCQRAYDERNPMRLRPSVAFARRVHHM